MTPKELNDYVIRAVFGLGIGLYVFIVIMGLIFLALYLW